MTTEYYKGYISIGNTFEYLKKIDNEIKFFVKSDEHMYQVIEKTKCFDEKGNELGFYENTKNIRKKETKQIQIPLSVIQFNYKFYLVPIGYANTIDEVSNASKILKTYFNIKDLEDVNFYSERVDRDNILRRYNNFKLNCFYTENFTPFEIVLAGHSREITNITYKRLFDLDIKEYKKNKDEFIKQNPIYKEEIEYIYKLNIGYLSLFWDVPIKRLLSNNFDKTKQSINKLNRKINTKIKQL